MAITSQDIHNQSFAIDRKGYDVDEVDVFLEYVADEIDLLNDQIAQLQNELIQARENAAVAAADETTVISAVSVETPEGDEVEAAEVVEGDAADIVSEKDALIKELQDQLAEKTANDNAISQALIIAQRSADEIIVKANAQASETMQDAREEADRIITRANADKQGVMDEIHKLEDNREETREGYADLLRDFIEDASRKLNELGFDDDIDSIPGIGRDAGKIDVVYEENVAFDYLPAEASEQITAAPVTPLAPGIEKDLSGFGDVEDDFEDVD